MVNRVQVKPNFVDRVIAYIDPIRGKARLGARATLALSGSYLGASKRRHQTENWQTSNGDANADQLFDLPTLRERSRDLIRNTPLAAGAINTKVTSVVGSGLKLKPQIDRSFLGLSDDEADAWEETTEREWRLFAESNECSACRTANIYALQDLAFRSVLENGDSFALYPYIKREKVPYELAVNLIEADRVCNEDYKADSDEAAGGIERDKFGAPTKYHIANKHPGNLSVRSNEWTKVPTFGARSGRRNISHLFRKLRIGQSRGMPDLAPVIEAFKQLGDYTEAEITAAVVSGLYTVFIYSENQNNGPDPLPDSGKKAFIENTAKMGSGAIIDLAKDERIETANPGRPNSAFDPFIQAILRQIGVALELPFELLIKHFTASYSASRAALLEAFKFFNGRRKWLVQNFCMPIYEAFLIEAVSKGRINAPGFLDGDPAIRAAYLASEWHGDAKGHIQPLQEIKAEEIAVNMGVKTLDEVCAESTGGSWHRKHKQRKKEQNMRREDGLIEEPAQAGFLLGEESQTDDEDEVDEDESD